MLGNGRSGIGNNNIPSLDLIACDSKPAILGRFDSFYSKKIVFSLIVFSLHNLDKSLLYILNKIDSLQPDETAILPPEYNNTSWLHATTRTKSS